MTVNSDISIWTEKLDYKSWSDNMPLYAVIIFHVFQRVRTYAKYLHSYQILVNVHSYQTSVFMRMTNFENDFRHTYENDFSVLVTHMYEKYSVL